MAKQRTAGHKGGADKKKPQPLPGNALGALPVVAIVGRPNVGKSTLFNRLIGQRLAIVEDVPGVTRDRHYADAFLLGRDCVIVDTGGFDPESDDPMKEGIARHVRMALAEADVVVAVLDATAAPMPADREAIRLLREADKPVIYIANKADSPSREQEAMALYELGMEQLLLVSAQHALGLGELEEAIVNALPPIVEAPEVEHQGVPRLAIVGRPNAGKSSLTNRLLGEERQLVDDRPGTTIDTIDTLVEVSGEPIVLIDTAGIRRKRAVRKERGVEGLSVMKAIRAMERSDAVVLMIDAFDGVAEQDARLCGLAIERGRALVIGLNKMDLMNAEERKKAIQRTREILSFAPWAPIVPVSAKTGRGTRKLIGAVRDALVEHQKRIGTAQINRFFEEVLEHHPPPVHKNKAVRLFYVTQASAQPPTFIAVTNEPQAVHFSYQRYVVNAIRKRFGFEGTPVRVFYRRRKRREKT
ncbi:MAG: ribosome biogenesis GTPase Der [Sandaracinaceae bacterium]|mgnify:FL=1|nr:MAG: ribosome biogenesis GTPase Der [Sandaracinaceae bacterium]HBQ18012.1 ribosome biogenesis GTPase Der [Myxococcales bacterium]